MQYFMSYQRDHNQSPLNDITAYQLMVYQTAVSSSKRITMRKRPLRTKFPPPTSELTPENPSTIWNINICCVLQSYSAYSNFIDNSSSHQINCLANKQTTSVNIAGELHNLFTFMLIQFDTQKQVKQPPACWNHGSRQ